MTKAQDALKVAQRRIAEAKASDATELALRVDGLEAIPPEISELTGLSSLDLRNTQISDATPLAGLTSLTDLFLSNTQIRDAAPLAGLTSLTDLDLGDTQISDAAPLAGLTSLTILYLNNRQIRDAAPLAGLTSLMGLVLNNTQISDAAPLAGLTSLTHLYLSNTQISDAAPLAGLTNLTDLDLDNTQISDAAPLASLTSLTNLGLSNMQVSDLRPLLPLSNAFGAGVLERLHFAGCAATLLDPELKRLSEIETIEDRTQSTFAYLNSLETWPPAGSKPPEDKVSGDGFAISDRGRLGLAGAGIGDAPDLDELHQDCRDKARALEASLAQTNEHGHIRDASQTYMEVISRHLPAITAHRLWSVGNTLRLSLEAHQASVCRPTGYSRRACLRPRRCGRRFRMQQHSQGKGTWLRPRGRSLRRLRRRKTGLRPRPCRLWRRRGRMREGLGLPGIWPRRMRKERLGMRFWPWRGLAGRLQAGLLRLGPGFFLLMIWRWC